MAKRNTGTPAERLVKLLSGPRARFKFRELKRQLGLSRIDLERAISEVRKVHKNLVYAKFDKTFYFADTPTWYSDQTDLSQVMPSAGSFGLISDTHFGSVADRLDLVQKAYEIYAKRGIQRVFHCGDMTDGFCTYRGHHQFIKMTGSQPQAEYVIRAYPRVEGITTYVIGGNHDLDSFKYDKVDRLSLVSHGFWHEGKEYKGRDDIVYLGQYSHRIILPQEVSMDMLHPIGSNVYAVSYKQQKRSEAMDRNLRPDIQVSGHYHTFNYTWLNHTHFIGCAGLQDETEYFKRLGLPRNVGFAIVHYEISDARLVSLSPEIFMY